MFKRLVIALGYLLTAMVTAVSAQEQPCVYPRQDMVSARLRVRTSQSGLRYDYLYSLENQPSAQQVVISFAVEAFTSDGTPPTQVSPANWEAGGPITESAFYVWDTFEEPRGLGPGMAASGFTFTQADLPAIVTFLAWGEVEPPTFPGREAPECENTNIVQNSFKGKTVGPKPPPKDLVALDFLNYLITLVHDSRQQGWITRDGAKTSLLAKLTNAKRKLEAGDTKVTKNMLKGFLNEVEATSCQEFDCPGNKPLTSEAYALLFFNGQFLWERL